jgi:hypothetical protein
LGGAWSERRRKERGGGAFGFRDGPELGRRQRFARWRCAWKGRCGWHLQVFALLQHDALVSAAGPRLVQDDTALLQSVAAPGALFFFWPRHGHAAAARTVLRAGLARTGAHQMQTIR